MEHLRFFQFGIDLRFLLNIWPQRLHQLKAIARFLAVKLSATVRTLIDDLRFMSVRALLHSLTTHVWLHSDGNWRNCHLSFNKSYAQTKAIAKGSDSQRLRL